MRSRGCLVPAAFLIVVGWVLLLIGWMKPSAQMAWAGAGFLAVAVVLGLIALYFRWQGWGD
jgi:Zn-dependent membrane protease YugP